MSTNEVEAPEADIVLHPNHPVFTQREGAPSCPVCQQALVPGTPVAFHFVSDTRYMVIHKQCEAHIEKGATPQ